MRPAATFILALSMALTLTSCVSSSNSAGETAEDVRARLQDSEMSMTAEMTVDYGDRVYDFTLDYSTLSDMIEIKAPEILAGVTVDVSHEDGSTVLIYEDAEIDTGALTDSGLSPVAALPAIVRQWTESYIVESYFETGNGTDFVAIKTQISDDVICTSWFDRSTGNPMKAEITSDDHAVIQCVFTSVAVE